MTDGLTVLALQQLVALRRAGREASEALALVEEGLPAGAVRAEFTAARRQLGSGAGAPPPGLARQLVDSALEVERLELVAHAAEARWETRAALDGARRLLVVWGAGIIAFLTVIAWLLPLELLGDTEIPGIVEGVLQALRFVGPPLLVAVIVGGRRLPLRRVPGGAELERAAEILGGALNPAQLDHLSKDEQAVMAAAGSPADGARVLAVSLATQGRRKNEQFLSTAPAMLLAAAVIMGWPLVVLCVRNYIGVFG